MTRTKINRNKYEAIVSFDIDIEFVDHHLDHLRLTEHQLREELFVNFQPLQVSRDLIVKNMRLIIIAE